MGAHQLLEVGPDAVGALGQHAVAAVEHLVEDLDALVRDADLIGVRVHQRPPHFGCVPVLDDRVQLAAHVLDGLADRWQQRFELGVHRLYWHRYSVPTQWRGHAPASRRQPAMPPRPGTVSRSPWVPRSWSAPPRWCCATFSACAAGSAVWA